MATTVGADQCCIFAIVNAVQSTLRCRAQVKQEKHKNKATFNDLVHTEGLVQVIFFSSFGLVLTSIFFSLYFSLAQNKLNMYFSTHTFLIHQLDGVKWKEGPSTERNHKVRSCHQTSSETMSIPHIVTTGRKYTSSTPSIVIQFRL